MVRRIGFVGVAIAVVVSAIAAGALMIAVGAAMIQQTDPNVLRIITGCPPGVPCTVPAPGPQQPEGVAGAFPEVAGAAAVVGAPIVGSILALSRRTRKSSREPAAAPAGP